MAAFKELARFEIGTAQWRKAMSTLARNGGKAQSAPVRKADRLAARGGEREPDLGRAERAMGGVVGLNKAAETARKELAQESKPLMTQPDARIAEALRLAAKYA
jgi:hypothetical protein